MTDENVNEEVQEETDAPVKDESKLELDEGAASVYIGVDPEYQHRANLSDQPIVTAHEVQKFVESGILEVVVVDDETLVTGNVGVLAGQPEANADTAPDAVVESEESDETTDETNTEETAPSTEEKSEDTKSEDPLGF